MPENETPDDEYVRHQRGLFTARLKAWRNKKGLTRPGAVEGTTVTSQHLWNIENGNGDPSFRTLVLLCRRMGFDVFRMRS